MSASRLQLLSETQRATCTVQGCNFESLLKHQATFVHSLPIRHCVRTTPPPSGGVRSRGGASSRCDEEVLVTSELYATSVNNPFCPPIPWLTQLTSENGDQVYSIRFMRCGIVVGERSVPSLPLPIPILPIIEPVTSLAGTSHSCANYSRRESPIHLGEIGRTPRHYPIVRF